MIQALESARDSAKKELEQLMNVNSADKVEKVLQIFKECKVDEWAKQLKQKFYQTAMHHLEETAVVNVRKKPLIELAAYLMERES